MQTNTTNNRTERLTTRANYLSVQPSLRGLRIALILVLAFFAGALAYQAPAKADIVVGWFGDQLFLPRGEGLSEQDSDAGRWYGDELTDSSEHGRSRWTRENATVALPGLGGSGATLTFHAQGWPANVLNGTVKQPTVVVDVNGTQVGQFRLIEGWDNYTVALPALPSSDTPTIIHFRALNASNVFTDTTTYSDGRAKVMRVDYLAMRSEANTGLVIPPPRTLALFAFAAALCYLLWLRVVRHANAAFVLTVAAVCVGAIALALVRVWAVALLPWAVGGLGLLAMLVWRDTLAHWLAQVGQRYTRSGALNSGLIVALVVWLVYAVSSLAQNIGTTGLATFREHLPDSLIYVLLAVGLLLLALVSGSEGVPRFTQWFVRALGSRRGATALLVAFLAVWLGYEWWVNLRLPGVGHADYADNAVVARNLLAGRGWVVDYVTQFYQLNPNGVTRPQETWPLLQPVWIAASFALLGVSDWAAKAPNIVFSLLLALLVYSAGTRIWNRRVGLVAVFLLLTNYLVFRLVIYATTDLAFIVFSFGALYLLYRACYDTTPRYAAPLWWPLVGSAICTGLMLLQKPSGGLIALGMGLWFMGRVWRSWRAEPTATPRSGRTLLRRSVPVATWSVVALLLLSPYLARNVVEFGKPFYSTESRDAWVLEYTDWDHIYDIYTPEQGLSETQGLPDRSWILRWGFDRTIHKLAAQAKATRNYLAPAWKDLPLNLSDTLSGSSGGALLFGTGAWLAALGLLGTFLRRRSLVELLAFGFSPYIVFLIVYWHANEERYFVMLIPWLALLAGDALWRIYDRLASVGRGGWAPLGLVLVIVALVNIVQPSWPKIADKILVEPQLNAGDVEAYQWLGTHATPDAVVMTRAPWQLNWHSELPALMVPNVKARQNFQEERASFLRIANYYNASYLVLDTAQRPSREVLDVIDGIIAEDNSVLSEVHRSPVFVDNVGPTIVYRFNKTDGTIAERAR